MPGNTVMAAGLPSGGLAMRCCGPAMGTFTGASALVSGYVSEEKPDVVSRRLSASKPDTREKVKPVAGLSPLPMR